MGLFWKRQIYPGLFGILCLCVSAALFISVALFVSVAHGVIETYEFENAEQEARYHHFTEILRCPKCQNQNLEGSDSPIASDLRRELAAQIRSGKSDAEIVDFMVARFGDFVLYDPPFKTNTLILWLAPAALLVVGLSFLFFLLRHRQHQSTTSPDLIHTAREGGGRSTTASLLSSRKSGMVLLFALSLALVASVLLYRQMGAGEGLRISELAREFYAEAEQANAEQRTADPTRARELLQLLANYQSHEEREHLQLLYLQGSLHAYLSEFEQAIPYYKEYLMAVPTDERILTEYVQILYVAAGRELTERVEFVVGRALALNPHNREVLALLAMHSYERGDTAQALNYWQQILQTLPAGDPARARIEKAMNAVRSRTRKG